MTYVGNNYTAGDIDNIVVDGLGTIGVAFVGFAVLIGLVILYAWFKKSGKKIL